MRFCELQDDDKKAKKLRSEELLQSGKNIEQVLYYQAFLYVSKVIYSKLISRYHNDPLASDFGIKKT